MDGFQNAADRKGRVGICLQQNLGNHGSGGRFAMGAADSDRRVVVFHQLSEKFRSGQHGKLQLFGTGTNISVTGLSRFFHNITQLPSQYQTAFTVSSQYFYLQ